MEQFIDILAIKEHYQLFDIQAMQSAITPLLEKTSWRNFIYIITS